MSHGMDGARKFTIGLPRQLYEEGERARHRLGKSRSQFVAGLYRAYIGQVERQRKIERYRAAYERFPPTLEEDALTVGAERVLGSEPA